ncbi:ankyrin repeat domain-containing protein [Wolbachia endosymbiont of Anopheles demeilloni]|uniref:ankyrin repeat domain-containing protein n=1 Tax=Wolbachia endosymbiont of Anopheles demeilloni TaxID=2748871 RepID=UPI001BD9B897|nr:ankyrin repeat domain-containing protein [Wolbachia endosymbiont of Anopheles demeilloni]UIP93313.1 ankyrin repeat domain-containing protein [Wolbachia endosymbiont of Anopheles demeilloni]
MYLALFKQILSIVNCENDLNGNNIVEKIQKQLQKADPSTDAEWKKKNFDINYKLSVDDYFRKKELKLLHLACLYNQENVVKALLEVKGINVNFQDGSGKTPLYIAVDKGHHKIVRALLEAGADPLVKDRCNKNLAEIFTKKAIGKAVDLGAHIFIIASCVAAIVVTYAYFFGVSLSVGAMAGIAVAAAVLTRIVAGGIIYEVYKPCDELKDAIAQAKSSLGNKLNGAGV